MVGRAGVMTESGSQPPIWSQSKQRQTGRAQTIFPGPSPLPLHFINGHSKLLSRHTELTYCRPIRACLFLSHDPSFHFPSLCISCLVRRGMPHCLRWTCLAYGCICMSVSHVSMWQVAASRSRSSCIAVDSLYQLNGTYTLSLSPLPSRVRLLTAAHSLLLYVKLPQYRIL